MPTLQFLATLYYMQMRKTRMACKLHTFTSLVKFKWTYLQTFWKEQWQLYIKYVFATYFLTKRWKNNLLAAPKKIFNGHRHSNHICWNAEILHKDCAWRNGAVSVQFRNISQQKIFRSQENWVFLALMYTKFQVTLY